MTKPNMNVAGSPCSTPAVPGSEQVARVVPPQLDSPIEYHLRTGRPKRRKRRGLVFRGAVVDGERPRLARRQRAEPEVEQAAVVAGLVAVETHRRSRGP